MHKQNTSTIKSVSFDNYKSSSDLINNIAIYNWHCAKWAVMKNILKIAYSFPYNNFITFV